MEQFLRSLSSASGLTIAVSVALGLMGLTALLMPPADRRQLRLPFGFFIAHLLLRGVSLLFEPGAPIHRAVSLLALATLLVTIGRSTVLLLLDVILGRRLDRALPKIIRDILQGLVYFLLLLALLREIGLEPGQLLTTSALLTAVIGLSLQDTLGNLVAGLSVQIQRPFSVGDWVQFDADKNNVGRVIEINWRATTLVTLDDVEVVVPNGALAKAALRVYSRPTPTVRRNLFVQVAYEVPPKRVHEVLLDAIKDTPGVVKDPPANVVTNAYLDSGIEYWVRIYINQFARRDIIEGAVRDRIWYAFQRTGIGFPYPHRIVHMQQHDDETRAVETKKKALKREQALMGVDFLSVITDEQRRELALRATTRLFSGGEVIVRQGDDTAELFIILRGEVMVLLETDGVETEITRLMRGQFFGEMALVTREKRKATVKSVGDCELLVIDHEAFEAVLHKAPGVVEELSKVLVERQLELDEHAARLGSEERTTLVEAQSSQLLKSIKRLFSLK